MTGDALNSHNHRPWPCTSSFEGRLFRLLSIIKNRDDPAKIMMDHMHSNL